MAISKPNSGLLIFRTVEEPWNSGKSAKSRKIHKNTQNTAKFGRKLPGIDYVAKNCVPAMMLKALPLVHFWSVLLLKEQMMTSIRKTLKTLVWSVQNWSIPSEICPENNHKIHCFLLIAFQPSLPWKFPQNSREIGQFFRDFVPKNPAKFDFLFRDLSEALLISALIGQYNREVCVTPIDRGN